MFAVPESHCAGNAEQDAGFGASGRPASVGVDHRKVGRELQRPPRGIGAAGDFRGVDGFDFPAEIPLEMPQGGVSGISFPADQSSARTGKGDQAGPEE